MSNSKWRKDPYTVSPHSRPDFSVMSHTHPAIPCASFALFLRVAYEVSPRARSIVVPSVVSSIRPMGTAMQRPGKLAVRFDTEYACGNIKSYEGSRGVLEYGANATVPVYPTYPLPPALCSPMTSLFWENPRTLRGKSWCKKGRTRKKKRKRNRQLHDA